MEIFLFYFIFIFFIRVKKWYWCIYTWFLNITMVQAWRLYRAQMKERHRLAKVSLKDLMFFIFLYSFFCLLFVFF